jgi:hypothetical protein
MDTISTLIAIRLNGIRLRVLDGRLLAEPKDALSDYTRTLIRDSRDALVELLESDPSADSLQDHAAALHLGRLVTCSRCQHCTASPTEQPDGLCDQHGPVWRNVVFQCPDYCARKSADE